MRSRHGRPGARAARWIAIVLLCSVTACSAQTAAPATTPQSPTETATSGPALGCTAVEAGATPGTASLLEPIADTDYTRGPSDASVTLLAYCDLQSPQCEIFNRALDLLQENHNDDLRLVYRLFPVPSSAVATLDKSVLSAEAALAAGNQGKFWAMRDLLHARYGDWSTMSTTDFHMWLLRELGSLGLDAAKFATDLDSPETSQLASTAYQSAKALGISSIPTVFINGQLQGRAALSYTGLDTTIGLIALGARQYRTCPAFDIDLRLAYEATVRTEKGDIVIDLNAERAPLAVNSFVFLARQGWFDGTTFHRVLPGFLAQGGDPSGTGSGGPGYYFRNEVYTDLVFDKPGVVAMANSGPDTNGSQFFITFAPYPELDGSYTIFGQVVKGMEVVESLTPRDPQITAGLPPGDRILGVTIETRP